MANRLLACLPCLCAIFVSLPHWLAVRGQPLDPDAQSYLLMAKSFTYLSLVSGPREPLWIALLALPVKIFGAHPDVIRLFGVIGFASLLLAFQLIARTLYGSLTAGIAALLLASSPWLIFRSTRGLREEASNARTLRPARAAPEEGMLAAPPRA